MVEHLLWEQGVVGSNPATPTTNNVINTFVFNFDNIITKDNFVNKPFPHFRIYDVLPKHEHDTLFSTFEENRNKLELPFCIWDKNNSPAVLDQNWNEVLELFWNSCDDVISKCMDYFPIDSNKKIIPTGVSMVTHNALVPPGKLIRDWHIDGSSKFVNIIYYMGTGEETHGEIELKNFDIRDETFTSYPYKANSMIIWPNVSPFHHRFRMSGNGFRNTIYTNYAYIDYA